MPLLAVLLTIATVAARDPLAPAMEAFAREEYARAEALALVATHPPHRGAALYVVGLARFRSGRTEEALAALDAAGRAADPPPRGLWQYNRAACLQALGRPRDAVAAFEDAAAVDPSLAALALVNAGHAAVEAGDRDAARELARRAREVASGGALELVDELVDAIDPGDPASAVAPAPVPAAGAAPRGLAARGAGWDAAVRAGAGYDSNVLQTGLQSAREVAPAAGEGTASFTATAGVAVARRWRPDDTLTTELAYAADQVAYASSTARDYGLQQHAVGVSLEAAPGERWRAGAAARGAIAFTGLDAASTAAPASPSRRGLRTLQRAGSAGAWIALDEDRHAATRLDLEWTRKDTPAWEFWYLNGDRLDVALSQELRAGPVEVGLAYRYRVEAIGTVTQTLVGSARYRVPCGMEGCAQRLVIPFGHASHAGAVSLRVPLGSRLAAGASGGVEWLRYRGASYLEVKGGSLGEQDLGRRVREDIRCSGGLWASVRAWRHLDLTLRWDAVMNLSNIARTGSCGPGVPCPHEYDYDDRNYSKHVVGLEGAWRW